jgi:hypothetical protein
MGIPAKLKSHQPAIYPPEISEAPIEWTLQEPASLTLTHAERFGKVNFHSNMISTGL